MENSEETKRMLLVLDSFHQVMYDIAFGYRK